jgi:hypothetical protein
MMPDFGTTQKTGHYFLPAASAASRISLGDISRERSPSPKNSAGQ